MARSFPFRFPALLLVALMALGGLVASARAELSFPVLTGRVVDAAGILDAATRARLDGELAAQQEKTTDQLVVATVPSLEGTSVEDYANRLFRHWKIGQADKNNGVLLLVAPNERKVRIEVGYGLEGVLPDAVASTIISTTILPAFRSGDFAGGISRGVAAILEILNLDPAEAEARAREAAEPALSAEDWLNILIVLVMVGFFLFVMIRQIRSSGIRGRRRGAAAGAASGWEWNSRSGGGGGWSSGGGGFSGGGGSSGGGGASGSW